MESRSRSSVVNSIRSDSHAADSGGVRVPVSMVTSRISRSRPHRSGQRLRLMWGHLLVLALLLVGACAPVAPDTTPLAGDSFAVALPGATGSQPPAPPAVGVSAVATSSATEPVDPASAPATTTCALVPTIAPGVLAATWPSRLGQRVRLRVRPVRALSITEWLVTAGGQRFVVLARPDTVWQAEHTFAVAGSTLAFIHGRTSLPELILADDECS